MLGAPRKVRGKDCGIDRFKMFFTCIKFSKNTFKS